MIEAARLMVRVGMDAKDAESGLRSFGSRLNSAAKSMAVTGGVMTAGITLPLLGVAKSALDMAGDFEQSMNVLQQVTGASEATMASLNAQALELGASTVFSAGEAAEGMLELGKAGMSTEKIMDAIGGVMDLAAAGGVSLGEAAGLTAAALNAFGLEASESSRIADLLAAAANASSASIGDLGSGMQQAGFAFRLGNQPIENLAASLAILTNNGLTGSDAGTALKNAFMRMIDPTQEAKDLMDELNLTFYDAQGQMLELPDIIDNINNATTGMTDQQRNAALATIFLSDGMKAMIPLLEQGSAGFNTMVGDVTEAGAATEVANARMGGLKGGLEELRGAVDSFLIGAAQPFLGTLGNLARGVGDAITSFGALPPNIINATLAFLGVLAVMGPVVAAIGAMGLAFGTLSIPIMLAIGAVALLTAAWVGNFGNIQGIVTTFAAEVQTGMANVRTAIDDAGLASTQAREAWSTLPGVFGQLATLVVGAAAAFMLFKVALAGTETGMAQLSEWETLATDAFGETVASNIDDVATAIRGFGLAISTAFDKTTFPDVKTLFDQFKAGDFQTVADTIRSTVIDLVVNLDTELQITAKAEQLKNKLVEAVNSLMTAASSLDFSGAKASFNVLKDKIQAGITTAINGISFTLAQTGLNTKFDTLETAVSTAVSGLSLTGAVSGLQEKMNGLRDSILGGLTSSIEKADFGKGGQMFAGMIDKVTDAVEKLDLDFISWDAVFQRILLGPLGTAINAIKWVMDSKNFDSLLTAVKNAISTIPWGDIGTSLKGLGTAIIEQLGIVLGDMATDVSTAFQESSFVNQGVALANKIIADVQKGMATPDKTTAATGKTTPAKTEVELPDVTSIGVGIANSIMEGLTASVEAKDWEGIGSNMVTNIFASIERAFTTSGKALVAVDQWLEGMSAWVKKTDAQLAPALNGLLAALDKALVGFLTGVRDSFLGKIQSLLGTTPSTSNVSMSDTVRTKAAQEEEMKRPAWLNELMSWGDKAPSWIATIKSWASSTPSWIETLTTWASGAPTWMETLTTWASGTPAFVTTLTSWASGTPAFVTTLETWASGTPSFVTTLTSWASSTPGFVSELTSWEFPKPIELYSWDWPSLSMPGWVSSLISIIGGIGGGGGGAAPETPNVPSGGGGSQGLPELTPAVPTASASAFTSASDFAAEAMGGINITINVASIANDLEMESLANRVAQAIARKAR
jgi:TP901 family phage tail tape measure protein